MQKLGFILVFILVLGSCQNLNPPEKPEQLLSPEEMENVLTDLVMLDAMISVNNFRIDNLEMNLPDFVLNKYEIDSITLAKNIKYYNEQYQQNLEIYENVKTNIEELKKVVEEKRMKKDSILKAEKEQEKSIKKAR